MIFGAQIGRREDLPGEGKIRVVIGPGELFPGASRTSTVVEASPG